MSKPTSTPAQENNFPQLPIEALVSVHFGEPCYLIFAKIILKNKNSKTAKLFKLLHAFAIVLHIFSRKIS
jgi:hypothetical protein